MNPDELVTISNNKTKQVKQVKRADLPQYGLPTDYQSQADIQAKYIMSGNGDANKADAATQLVLNQNKYINPYSAEGKKKQAKEDQTNEAKSLIQATLQNYMDVPKTQKGPLAGQQGKIPLIGGLIAPQAKEYESGLAGEAPAIAKIFGGQGSGLRITQAEIKSWMPFFPSTTKTDEQNKYDVQKLNTLIKGRFGTGLDPEYLQEFGVSGDKKKDSKLPPITSVKKNDSSGKNIGTRLLQGAGKEISQSPQALMELLRNANINPLTDPIGYAKAGVNTVKGIGEQLAGMTGTQITPEGVNISPQRALDHAIDNPISTTLTALPAIGGVTKGLRAGAAEAEANTITPRVAERTLSESPSKLYENAESTAGKVPQNPSGGLKLAARTFNSAFTIPTKRAKDLRPLDTSQKMVDYGINGSMDQLKNVAQQVTGKDGVLTNLVNDAVANMDKKGFRVPGTQIQVTNGGKSTNITSTITDQIMPEINNSLELTSGDKKMINSQLRSAENIKTPGETLAKVREFQNLGHQYLNKSTYLTGDIRKQNIGKAYLQAADVLNGNIEKAAGSQDIVSQLKTPQVIDRLNKISPKLAEDFKNTTSLKEIRSLEAPFVRLSKMIDLTEQGAQSASSKVVKFGTGAGIGGLIGGLPGAALGMVATPVLEGAVEGLRTPFVTKAANLMNKLPKGKLPPIQ